MSENEASKVLAAVRDAAPRASPTQSLNADRESAITDDLRADTALKKTYAKWFIGILIGQLLLMNLIFGLVGAGWLRFSDYALHLYMGGTLAEVFGVVLVITRYLFPKR
ncbi:MAG: hypothetical protein LBU11_13310 [Zoogloeaceae bacterium]|jgi:hypothetical protein|nr:hypothetical protein [Zoogloeaceae bacterium]